MELYNRYKGKGLEIVQCIYENENYESADQNDIIGWVNRYKLTFTVVNDPDYSTVNKYKFNAIPLNIIIDQDFIIQLRDTGFDKQKVVQMIEELL